MKKMAYTIIFLVILVVLVFAGCLSFSPNIETTTEEETTALSPDETAQTTEEYVPVTNEAGESVTNTEGEVETTKIYVAPVSPSAPVTQAPVTQSPDTTAPSNGITSQPGEQTTALNATAAATEYDILRSGTFHIKGSLLEGGEQLPLEMAVTPVSMYAISDFEGIEIGMLINNNTTYMIYPQKSAYLEMSEAVMSKLGMETGDMLSSSELNFSKFGELSSADSITTETVNGVECTVYAFNSSPGTTRFFMNGSKLVRFANYDASGNLESASNISYISGSVPEDKISPPASYKGYKGSVGLFGFMALFASDLF